MKKHVAVYETYQKKIKMYENLAKNISEEDHEILPGLMAYFFAPIERRLCRGEKVKYLFINLFN